MSVGVDTLKNPYVTLADKAARSSNLQTHHPHDRQSVRLVCNSWPKAVIEIERIILAPALHVDVGSRQGFAMRDIGQSQVMDGESADSSSCDQRFEHPPSRYTPVSRIRPCQHFVNEK